MAIALMNLYQALRDAGAPEDSARRAAEEVADFDMRLHDMAKDVTLVKWMKGTTLAIVIGLAVRAFF